MVAFVELIQCRPMVQADERQAKVKLERGAIAWVPDNVRRVRRYPVTGRQKIFICDEPPDVEKLLDNVDK